MFESILSAVSQISEAFFQIDGLGVMVGGIRFELMTSAMSTHKPYVSLTSYKY